MATHKDQKLKTKPKSRQSMSKPAPKDPFREDRTAKKVAPAVKQRRTEALRASAAADVSAILIAERNERDDELAEQIARSFEWRRRSTAHLEHAIGGARRAKRARITVILEEDLIRTAQALTGIKEKSALIGIALTELVERETVSRLGAQGEIMPNSKRVPRSRLP